MITLPFDATVIASSHSSLTGLMAGFALAALFLLIERTGFKDTLLQKRLSRAMLLLFIASIVGTLSSFLYSSMVGIEKTQAYIAFVTTAPAFAITVFVLLAGINEVFKVFGSTNIVVLARRISYFVIVFSVLRVWQDLSVAVNIFGLSAQTQAILIVAFVVPLIMAAIIIASRQDSRLLWFARRSFTAFCYVSVLFCLGIAFVSALINIVPDIQSHLFGSEAFFLIGGLSCLGMWTMLLLPHEGILVSED